MAESNAQMRQRLLYETLRYPQPGDLRRPGVDGGIGVVAGARRSDAVQEAAMRAKASDAAMAEYIADHNARVAAAQAGAPLTSPSGYVDPYTTFPSSDLYRAPADFTAAHSRLLDHGTSMQREYNPFGEVDFTQPKPVGKPLFQDPNDPSYHYMDLEDGSYAVFRDGVQTGTARRDSRAARSIANVMATGKPLPVLSGPRAMDILQSKRFTEHDAFRSEDPRSAPFRGELTAQYETEALRNKS